MKITLTLIAVFFLASSAVAVGKVTVDPNKAGARSAPVATDIDSRLDQKVTCDARRETVSAILASLSRQTGVVFYAGYNSQDWQVRDRRMNVFATDMPLRTLMDSISRVMKFQWSRKELNGRWTYRLYMDRNTLLGVERQRVIEEDRLRQLGTKQRQRVLDDLTKAAAMSDEELQKLKTTDPLLYCEHKIGWSALMPELFSQIPAAKQAWLSGEALVLSGADCPAESQQTLLNTVRVMGAELGRVIGPEASVPEKALADLSKIGVAINSNRGSMDTPADKCVGDVTIAWQGGGNQTAFINPDSPLARVVGEDYVRIMETGPVGASVQGEMNSGHIKAIEAQDSGFGEPLIKNPEDPALAVKVKLKPMGETFADLLRSVSKVSGYAVVSDSFATFYRGFSPVNSEVPLRAALDDMCAQHRYNWKKQGDVLEFRDRDWFRKRGYQVPDAWLDPWRKSIRTTGSLSLDALAQTALFDDDQARENLNCDEILDASGVTMAMLSCRYQLRAYACLDDAQRQAMWSDIGLDLGSISPSHADAVSKMLWSKPLLYKEPNAAIRLTCRQTTKDKALHYSWTATSAAGQTATWSFAAPKYQLSRVIAQQPWAGVTARALELLAEAKKTNLADHHAWYHLGLLLYDGKRYPDALEAFERSCLLAQKRPQLLFGPLVWKGHVLDLLGRRDDAIACYTAALEIDMGDKVTRYGYDMTIDRKWVEDRLKTPFKRG